MNLLFKEIIFLRKYKISIVAILWFALSFLTALSEVVRGPKAINNYHIFKQVFFHTIQKVNLYVAYPDLHFDTNHYGILFSIFIAPFALMPDWMGCLLWCMANAYILYFAIIRLPISEKNRILMLAIILIELLTSTHNTQSNPMMTAFILLAFIFVLKQKEWWATFFITAGFFIKIYSIVALVTFLFSNNKTRFILAIALWLVILFCIPMIISSPGFVLQSYLDWYHSLNEKNIQNTSLGIVVGQNISVHGMIQRIFYQPALSQFWILLPAAILNILPLFRLKEIQSFGFKMNYLSLCLISVTIFSSSAESSTYVMAVTGVALWYVLSDMKNKLNILLLAFTVVFTILSPTDLFPNFIQKGFFVKYSLKALPCFAVWCVLIFTLLTFRFNKTESS